MTVLGNCSAVGQNLMENVAVVPLPPQDEHRKAHKKLSAVT